MRRSTTVSSSRSYPGATRKRSGVARTFWEGGRVDLDHCRAAGVRALADQRHRFVSDADSAFEFRDVRVLLILYGACTAALDAFRAADDPVDEQLVADLETMVTRTKGEIQRLTTRLAEPSQSQT